MARFSILSRSTTVVALCLTLAACTAVDSPSPTQTAKEVNPTSSASATSMEAPTSVEVATPELVEPKDHTIRPDPNHKSIALSPTDSLKKVQMQPGYRLERVLSEPAIQSPAIMAFDGNGRMFVAEMRSYMLDVDGTDKFEPMSRVSLHTDTDGDGVYDHRTVYADNLMLPRILLPLDDRVIIGETNTDDLYIYRDTDGDGVADQKDLWHEGGPRGGNLEHQPNGAIWAMDNAIYATYWNYRLRIGPGGKAIKEDIPVNGGQWGLAQDSWGKVWFVNAGAELGPVHFQHPILYGQFNAANQHVGEFKVVWPIDNIPDTQGGRGQLRDDNTLNHFTATCGLDVFRGDRLPADLQDDLIFAEPVGRLVRRAKVTVEDGTTRLANAYEQNEFIRSTDPLFRPMNMATAPDGTLYIIDMYRGIIQESQWTKKGSYLREQIVAYGLDKEIGGGRIYRLAHADFQRGPSPRMLDETPAQWVQHLNHPNGWWRDTAQKLLVLKQDLSVVPALIKLARFAPDPRSSAHALWTLDGLDSLDPALVIDTLKSTNENLRIVGLRLADALALKSVDAAATLQPAIAEHLDDPSPSVVIQAMLSLRRVSGESAADAIKATAGASASTGVYDINEQLWADSNTEDPFLLPLLGPAGLKSFRAGRDFYNSLCFACHGTDGLGTPSTEGKTIAPSLVGSERVLGDETAAISILLHGLQGPIKGTDFGAPMVPMNSYSDQELANVLNYVRNSFGNRSPVVAPEKVTKIRQIQAERSEFWTLPDLTEKLPALAIPLDRFVRRFEWTVTADDAGKPGNEPAFAIDDDLTTAYLTSKSTPFPGMWYQIELPAPGTIRSIEMNATGNEESFAPFFLVQISNDGQFWSEPIVTTTGELQARVHFGEPVTTKFIRITINKKSGWQTWAINNLELYGIEN
jgi:mono/diheme cytochrome c family protein/glucose/arabinose dehydrogenase